MIVSVYPEDGQTSYTVNEMDSVVFECTATGIPAPDVVFDFGLIESRVIVNDSSTVVEITRSEDEETVFQVTITAFINSTVDSDSGVYWCNASNNVSGDPNTVNGSFDLIVQGTCRVVIHVLLCHRMAILLLILHTSTWSICLAKSDHSFFCLFLQCLLPSVLVQCQ